MCECTYEGHVEVPGGGPGGGNALLGGAGDGGGGVGVGVPPSGTEFGITRASMTLVKVKVIVHISMLTMVDCNEASSRFQSRFSWKGRHSSEQESLAHKCQGVSKAMTHRV